PLPPAPMDLSLNNHVTVVTGGASGIGRAVAAAFAAEQARVAIWDVSADVERVAADLAGPSGRAVVGCHVDVTDRGSIAAALAATEAALGPVEHLVHAAATGSGKFGFPFTSLTPDDWPRVLEVNVMGMVNVAHALAPGLVERRRGTMIYIASVAGQIGSQTDPPYSASKAANINFAQCLAKDLAPHGVRVNTICPGMVRTPLNRAVWQAWHDRQPPEHRRGYEDWAGEKVRAVVPLGRWQQPEDVADMAVFLSSARAGEVTGQTINVDGGFVMHW
ncbi:MAG TPA: SDR family oxidoreductase, partial [Planctomycetaceae bacterium]|nr:SDR family oxidoreductase [Planctomycetaceae bacterium]